MTKNETVNSDNDLGIERNITRRDFLNGVSVGVAGALACQAGLFAALDGATLAAEVTNGPSNTTAGAEYPPALTGMRGSYDATYKYAHMLRDDAFWESAPRPRKMVERDRKSTRLNSSHEIPSRMPSSA